MMKQIVFFLSFCFFLPSFAENYIELSTTNDFKTTEEILATAHQENSTDCASNIFSNALIEHSDEIKGNEPENNVRIWAHNIMSEAAVLEQVLKCPEVSSVSDTTTIAFTPIVYEFDNGRKITINYSTQPKVLKQKLILSKKRSLPNGDANPQLMDFNDP
nr:hypothetical protein [Candidatus Enterousia merdequi]